MSVPSYRKCYFLAPTRNNPPEGPIRLGNILASPKSPEDPINTKPFEIEPASVYTHNEYDWSLVRDKDSGFEFGIWASFLQLIFGIGGAVAASWTSSHSADWKCKKLCTVEFTPTQAFVSEIVQNQDVRDYLIDSFHKKIYMITGLKIASGASAVVKATKERGLNLHIGFDGTSLGIPLSAGPYSNIARKTEEQESFGNADDFVFAFRLRQIKVKAKGKVQHKAFTDGAFFDIDSALQQGLNKEDVEIVVEELVPDDASGAEFRMKDNKAFDETGGGDCLYVNVG